MSTDHGSTALSPDLKTEAQRYSHLANHLRQFKQITGEFPQLVEEASGEYESQRPHILYHLGGPIYAQVYGNYGEPTKYFTIEPTLEGRERELFALIKDKLLKHSSGGVAPSDEEEYEEHIDDLLDDVTYVTPDPDRNVLWDIAYRLHPDKVGVSQETYDKIRYRLVRDIVGLGPLEPIMRDPANEDIHVIGPEQVDVDHGVYGLINTNIEFPSDEMFDNWIRNMGERMGDPVSDADPVVDSTLPDGSRINIIYSDDISLKGSSLTIRQGDDVPLSVFQITEWGTLSPELAAYLWIALENERTVFVVGETASGKTTTLNAITSFIPRDSKIYTAEDTAEVLPPHNTWQQLLTREGKGGEADIDMFDLVAAALRSRPDYIIVGEVRGEEGRMAFQAAQTGHPVMLTFHASDIVSMIQRFTGDPIDIPETFMDNADVALFQNRVKRGNDVLRRVTSVQEIEGYSDEMGGVVTREVFSWDPVEDEVRFQGMNNSFVLEEQVATLLGYADTRKIYDDLEERAEIIRRACQEGIVGYHEVNNLISDYQLDGVEALPFDLNAR
ncbi:MAG: type II/IV secretion system ATPase subunit [Halorientalis sp.]